MNKIKIAIIDVIGLNYDGTTLEKKGIGGSESSIISIARELVKLDFDVTIFNDCNSPDTQPGVYNGVTYYPIDELGKQEFGFDIVVSQRTVIPFTPRELYDQVKQRGFSYEIFEQVKRPNQLKILWQQDTFIWGDHILETLLINGNINEVFCISDWHVSYTTNSSHGPKRNFEVLKNYVFNTRNAINRWIDWVDVKKKDPNLFVYNASVTKGMVPLIENIWPVLKKRLPNAKLKVIGGYYNFRNETVNDANKEVIRLQKLTEHDPSVEFTGIIPQPKIAEIMATASYNLYPGAFPETSGISTIESINYNTPIIGTRFGAMEESGTDFASYYIDYPIEPNSLYPWINKEEQVQKYIDLVLRVVYDSYLHQQKQNACNTIKDVSTWDTVALQWKQHFYNKLGISLSIDEQEKVNWINYRVHKVFGRRFTNDDEIIVTQKPTSLNSFNYGANAPRIAIFDIVGAAYDGGTLNRRGLGGSESAVVLLSKELVKLGFDVTVYNGCDEEDCSPGTYDGVKYIPISSFHTMNFESYDVVISSRVVTPFVPKHRYDYKQTTHRTVNYKAFEKVREDAKLKVLWLHDTFCWGDDILEDLVSEGSIDEVWTLSDFHNMYAMTCSHPRLRMYEVLRDHMWTTRNGIVKYFDKVDINSKDPNLFIFNSNMSKGLASLLNDVWPKIKTRIPEARLTVIGGYYKLGAAFGHDNEKAEFMKIAGSHMNDPTITFTGILKQSEIADICAKASFMIYPATLPETYGISTLESLYANTPLLTCKFGALEETASQYSYFINYPMTPNGLFPHINGEEQISKFVDMVVDAYNDKKSHVDRMNNLDVIKDIAGWDCVALEWKQHIFSKLGLFITKDETRQINYQKSKYHKIFKRRYSTPEEWLVPKQTNEQKIVIISPFYNANEYIEKCILSIASQDYDNYEHWLVDDASTDNTIDVIHQVWNKIPDNVKSKIKVFKNKTNQGSVLNYLAVIQSLNDDDIVIMLDGDDSLVNRSDVLSYYNEIHKNYDFTYGSCWSMADNIPLVGQPYPPEVKQQKTYKNYRFNWNMPYTHLRSLKAKLIKYSDESKFKDNNGNWFKAGGDNAIFYTAIENVDSSKIFAVSDIVYNYNDASPLNDYKVNRSEQDSAINQILGKQQKVTEVVPVIKNKKRILIAIPTNKNIEAETFKSIYDLEVPEGYETEFQFFYGYQVDQVRNLIAHWVIHGNYDYLLSIDSDITFKPDTLKKMLSHNKDIVSGIYIQRIPGQHVIEIMRKNNSGGVSHVDWNSIKGQGLVSIDSCGFGCVLIKKEVFTSIEYPHFVYQSAINHSDTISEDVYFCMKARNKGFTLWADTSIICDHIGSYKFKVNNQLNSPVPTNPIKDRLRELYNMNSLPKTFIDYMMKMKNEFGVNPSVIYDIGSNVLHWTRPAREIWNDSEFYLFEALEDVEFLYKENNLPYHLGVLSDQNNKEIIFYENKENSAGNSYYKENELLSPDAAFLYDKSHEVIKRTVTLDTVVKIKKLPLPDLIKIDVQGAELDILKGAQNTLQQCKDLIVEIQHAEYNIGAPQRDEVIAYIESLGFRLVTELFSSTKYDGDYHFTRR